MTMRSFPVLLLLLTSCVVNAFVTQSFDKSIATIAKTSTSSELNARPQTQYRIVQNNILNRRTINDFSPTLPTHWEKTLTNAIQAAIYAPNHKRTEPWRFYLLGPTAIEKICTLNAELVTAKKGEAAGEKKLKRWMEIPGWLVVTCVKSTDEDDGMETPTSVAREDYAAGKEIFSIVLKINGSCCLTCLHHQYDDIY